MILLDTHVVIWWPTGALERLSKEARVALEGQEDAAARGGLLVSAISCSKDRQGHQFYELIGHADLNVAMNDIPCFQSLADEHPQARSH